MSGTVETFFTDCSTLSHFIALLFVLVADSFTSLPFPLTFPLFLRNYHLLILNESLNTLHDFNTAC